MPRGSSSENIHSYYREAYETSPSTINSLNSLRSNPTADRVGSEPSDPPNDREYSNISNDLSKHLILSKYFNSTRANNSTYENLCSGCGYGVFAARGKLCNFCQYVLNGYLEDNSNIYENICDKCSELYSGVECSVCSQNNKEVNKIDNVCLNSNNNNKSTSKKLKKRLFHSLFGSLKRVKSLNVPAVASASSSRKLQIIHNVDGYDNVFRTNETFDLSRICELKRLKSSASDQHIYGKLRKTDDHLQTPYECVKQKSQSDDYLIAGTGSDTLFRSTSENSHDSCFLLRHLQDSVGEWMTSLRCETHDYSSFGAPDTVICNPKSIPANFSNLELTSRFGIVSSDCSGASLDQQVTLTDAISEVVRLRSFSDESKQFYFAQQMVNEFKRGLMEKQQAQSTDKLLRKRRQGIYLKLDGIESKQRLSNYQVDLVGDHHNGDSNCFLSPSTAQSQAVPLELAAASEHSRRGAAHQFSKRCGIYEKDSEFVTDILQAFDSFLLRESDVIVEEDEVNSCCFENNTSEVVNDHSLAIVSSPERIVCSFSEQKINIEQIIQQLLLSKNLNKIVICYDAPLKVFLSAVDQSQRLSALKFPKLFKKFRRFKVFLSAKQVCYAPKRVNEVQSDTQRTRSLASEKISAIEYIPEEQVLSHLETKTETIMTVPNRTTNSNTKEEEEEPIYQPIWKFKTVGEVQENNIIYEYYDHSLRACDSSASLAGVDIEDHDEWEPDDEFTFTTKLDDGTSSSGKEMDTLSVNTTQSSSGSTITGYASSISTMTIASLSSVTHHIFRNICIFYSPQEPKIRAVLYDYDRNRCWSYFAQQPAAKQTGQGVTSCSSPPTTSAPHNSCRGRDVDDYYYCDANKFKKPSESGSRMFADSVQAWKYMLLDVNYLEDEEDMIVSESQILKAQAIKEMESTPPPPVGVLQRFKSISSGNLLDMPAEEDKKSITERVRNKLQRGVFKLQTRSPKENKKSRNIFRRNEATSLYLEDGMKPKYPIFRASLEQLEMNDTSYPDVPRFVVDCIEYIEQKDCIQMDGLYRASGNKVAVDELKQKLTESYIYDPKLLVTDDIHTLTSLLKLFFRELATPLIPQDTYQRLAATRNLMETSAIESMKTAFSEMRNPNRATLKFLIKHLTTVAHYSNENRMPASNLAIVWGPCILSANQIEYDIARMNTLAKVLIENYDRIFGDNERLVS